MNRRAVLGIAGSGGVGAVAVLALLVLLLSGRCSFVLPFGKAAAVATARPSASATAATPIATATPTATPSVVASATPTVVPTAKPTTAPTATPAAQLIISSLPVHVGEVGVAYAPVTLTAGGGTPPFKWSTNPGALPAGLSLSQDGVLSGNPTAAGDFTPTFRVDDSAGQAAGAAAPFSVAATLAVTQPCAGTCVVEVGCTAACLTAGAQSGGVGPYSYILSGTPPAGTNFANSLTLSGSVGFVPGAAQFPYSYAISVGDSLGAPAPTANVKLLVYAHVSTKGGNVLVSTQGGGGSIAYSQGYGTPTATLTGAPPKTTVSVDPIKLAVNITVPGGLASGSSYSATLTLTDPPQALCGPAAGQNCTASATVIITVR